MANLRTDSPVSHRIVRAFLDFLDSVEPAPGVDVEGFDVARECLSEAFKLSVDSTEDTIQPGLLVNIFRLLEANENQRIKTDSTRGATSLDAPISSSTQNVADASHSEASKTQEEDWTREPNESGISKDELFGKFFAALEKNQFFNTMPDGRDDPVQLDKATCLFHDALNEMENTGCQAYNCQSLAEVLKSQGNRAMQLKLYSDAIQLYSFAISLCEDNAVYYCNRAAAYTQVHRYTEAIRDCLKSIEINPNYSKAYSRLGTAYYAQGSYSDALNEGFKKASQLDPENESIKENIRVAEQKLKEERKWTEWHQNTSSSGHDNQEFNSQSTGGSRTHGPPPPFTSMSFNANDIPIGFANMLGNVMTNARMGQHSQDRQGEFSNVNGSDGPEVRMGGNMNLNIGENMPEELRGALRSMMGMFSGAVPHGNPQDTMNGRSSAN